MTNSYAASTEITVLIYFFMVSLISSRFISANLKSQWTKFLYFGKKLFDLDMKVITINKCHIPLNSLTYINGKTRS